MSTLDVNRDGIRIPLWVVGVFGALIMGWNGFITLTLLAAKEELVRLRTQFEADVVPRAVAEEFRSMRERMNAADVREGSSTKLLIELAKDVTYLREQNARKP